MTPIQAASVITVLLVTWGLIGRELWQKHQAGSLVRVLRYEAVFGFFGTIGMLVGSTFLREWWLHAPTEHGQWLLGLTALVTCCGVFLVGLPQLKLREGGFWYRGTVIRWSEIASYQWADVKAGALLLVWIKNPRRGYSPLCLSLATKDKKWIDARLLLHCHSRITLPLTPPASLRV